jgi:hypothetical protein
MPLAMPVSSRSINDSASLVLLRCVPPQNSIEYSDHAGFSGSSSMAGTS